MKRLMFLLLAVVLLGSMSAFAQSNGESLKGDVNGDDVVDVADVVAVLQIMKEGEGIGERQYYVSIGTTPVTASNFKVVNNATQVVASSYERQYDFTPNGTDYVYVLVGGEHWVSSITDSSNTPVDFSIVTDVEISGYTVYRTDNKVSGKVLVNIEHVIYYWYVGQTDPSTMTDISPIINPEDDVADADGKYQSGWRKIGTTLPIYSSSNMLWNGAANKILTGSTKATTYVALPNSTIKVRDGDGGVADGFVNSGTKTIDGVTYYIYQVPNLKIFNGLIF